MRNLGITVDAKAIAHDIYGMMDDTYRGALAFGMLPGPLMELLRKHLVQKFDDIAQDRWQSKYGAIPTPETVLGLRDMGLEFSVADPKLREEWVNETIREIELALYAVAPMLA